VYVHPEPSSESVQLGALLFTFVQGSWHSENLIKIPLIYSVLYFNLGRLELCLEGWSHQSNPVATGLRTHTTALLARTARRGTLTQPRVLYTKRHTHTINANLKKGVFVDSSVLKYGIMFKKHNRRIIGQTTVKRTANQPEVRPNLEKLWQPWAWEGVAGEALYFEILHFSIIFLAKKVVFLVSRRKKWNFTIYARPWIYCIFKATFGKINYCPPLWKISFRRPCWQTVTCDKTPTTVTWSEPLHIRCRVIVT